MMREYLFMDDSGRKVAYYFHSDSEAMEAARNIPKHKWQGVITVKYNGGAYPKTIGWVLPPCKVEENHSRTKISIQNQCDYGRKD